MFICLCLSGDCRRRACKVEVEHAALAHLNAEQAAFQTSMTEVQVTKQKKDTRSPKSTFDDTDLSSVFFHLRIWWGSETGSLCKHAFALFSSISENV